MLSPSISHEPIEVDLVLSHVDTSSMLQFPFWKSTSPIYGGQQRHLHKRSRRDYSFLSSFSAPSLLFTTLSSSVGGAGNHSSGSGQSHPSSNTIVSKQVSAPSFSKNAKLFIPPTFHVPPCVQFHPLSLKPLTLSSISTPLQSYAT